MLSPLKFVGIMLIFTISTIMIAFVLRPQYSETCGPVDSIKMVHPAGLWESNEWTVNIDNTTYWFYEDSTLLNYLQTFQSAQHFNATVKISYSNDFHVQSVKIQEC